MSRGTTPPRANRIAPDEGSPTAAAATRRRGEPLATVMQDALAFLHTAAAHVATFDALVGELAPGLQVSHTVSEALLQQARSEGSVSPLLTERARLAARNAALTGARVVLCTCSTIGSVVESMATDDAFIPMRIDRPMADLAVARGGRVLVAAALASTIAPARELLESSAQRAGTRVEPVSLLIERAWPRFEAGDHDGYIGEIVDSLHAHASGCDVVVLAQASMSDAQPRCADLGIPVLASPRLGVQAAIAALREARARVTISGAARSAGESPS